MKFSNEIEKGVGALPGVRRVDVRYSDVADWSEHDISPAGRRKLEALREKRRAARGHMSIAIQPGRHDSPSLRQLNRTKREA